MTEGVGIRDRALAKVRAGQAVRMLQKALRTGSGTDLEESIDLLRQVLMSLRESQPIRSQMLSNLGLALRKRFERTGTLADLDEAITVGREAVSATPSGTSEHAAMMGNLAFSLRIRFELTAALADVNEAVTVARQALAALPEGHPDSAALMTLLAEALQRRFSRCGPRADLDDVISFGRQAVAATRGDHPERGSWLNKLSLALQDRFARTGMLADLDEAITVGRQAVAATPNGHPNARLLSNLGSALRSRFERTGTLGDLDEAITVGRQVVAATPEDHPDRGGMLSNLSAVLSMRSERTGQLGDLDEAITVGRQVVAATPEDHRDRGGRLSRLGVALRARFERTGALGDLDEAITVGRQAVAASPGDHRDRGVMMSNLSAALLVRSGRTGALGDLDEAITVGRQAVAATPEDHPERAGMLSNLGVALRARLERTGVLADLDEAITVGRQAVAATPGDHPDLAWYLSNLSAALSLRSGRTGALADLNEAITAGRQAVAATPEDHPERAGMLSNLAAVLRARFEPTGMMANLLLSLRAWNDRAGILADLDEIVSILRQAVAATPEGHPALPKMLSNLSNALRSRFAQTGALVDLDEAVTVSRQAVSATLDDEPSRAIALLSLGAALESRFERTRTPADLDEAVQIGRQVAAMGAARPVVRVLAARKWGQIAASAGRWHEAAKGFDAAVSLLSMVAPRSLIRDDQENALGRMAGLASDAAACCVRAGLTDRAVELLEQGRGILLGQALDTRTDLTDLAERHPGLADRFAAVRDVLDLPGEPRELLVLPPERQREAMEVDHAAVRLAADRQRTAAEEFEQVIQEIRNQPGFASFLRSPVVGDLLAAAADGPIVIVNVSRFGSHALIMTSSGVLRPVALDDVTPRRVSEQVSGLRRAFSRNADPSAPDRFLTGMLGWLWDAISGPVLKRLRLTGPPPDGQPWPRLWWCPVGPLSFLPLHAAGHHQTRSFSAAQTVMDRAVSSYTPTVRALIHAKRARSGDRGFAENGSTLVVAMPQTPGEHDLPGAEAEASKLRQRLDTPVITLSGPEATRAAVISALPAARWAHFACHGFANLSDPSASCLLLADSQRLTVTDIARLRLHNANLAYLSACSTAQPGSKLPDEVIHLASAFQLAGYRQVIGTLWPIADRTAVRLATDLYDIIADDPNGAAADALHAVTVRLRNRKPHTPAAWASHIHSGA